MDHIPVSKKDLIKFHNDKETVRKTALQIIKDFAEFSIDITFPENLEMAYNQLFDELAPIIKNMVDRNMPTLYSVLYRIDVNEIAIRKGAEEMNHLEIHDVISHLILERELKKVITRQYFSKNL